MRTVVAPVEVRVEAIDLRTFELSIGIGRDVIAGGRTVEFVGVAQSVHGDLVAATAVMVPEAVTVPGGRLMGSWTT